MATPQKVVVEVPAESEFVAVIRLAVSGVAARMGFTLEDIEDIKVAVSEACTNVVQHAYPVGPRGVVKVESIIHQDALEIVVSDSGSGFDTHHIVSAKTQPNAPDHGVFGLGLGLTFIRSLMDGSEVASQPGEGTVVRMHKRVPLQHS